MKIFLFSLLLAMFYLPHMSAASTEKVAGVAIVWISYEEAVEVSKINKGIATTISHDTVWTLMEMRIPAVFKELFILRAQGYQFTKAVLDELNYQTGEGRFGWIYEKKKV